MFLKNFGFVYFLFYGLVKYLPTPIGEIGRWLVLKFFIGSLGWKTYIRDGVTITYPRKVRIGRNCTLNEFAHLNGAGGIDIGDWVRIAHGVSIISEDHVFDDLEANIAEQGSRPAKVTIENNVWIGAGVKILKGVTIGRGAVIGAGAIVTKDVPPGAISVGNPARVLRYRTPAAETASKPKSQFKRNVLWMTGGNLLYAACQWAMLVALTKLLAPSLVGSFSLALAISTPFIFFANLNLRAILSSDVSGRNEFRDYLGVRILALGAASAAILLTTAVLYRDLPLFLVTCLVLVSKFFDSISDLIYGVLQKHERNAPIAKSRMIQGVTQFLAIFSVIFLTKNLLWGVTALAIVSALVTLLYDLPNAGKTLAEFPETPESSRRTALTPRFDRAITGPLLVLAFPLGLVYFLDQLMVNIPRVLLGTFASKSSVAVFAALSYVVVIGMTVVSAITESARPRLARQFREDRGAFLKLLGRLVAIGVGLGVAGIIFSAAVGKPALTLLYKREYGLHSDILVILMVSATFWFASSFLSAGIIAADNYRVMVPIFVAATIATTLSALYLVPNFGLAGAAWSLGVGMVARVGLSCYVLWVMLRHPLLGTPEAVVADNYSAE